MALGVGAVFPRDDAVVISPLAGPPKSIERLFAGVVLTKSLSARIAVFVGTLRYCGPEAGSTLSLFDPSGAFLRTTSAGCSKRSVWTAGFEPSNSQVSVCSSVLDTGVFFSVGCIDGGVGALRNRSSLSANETLIVVAGLLASLRAACPEPNGLQSITKYNIITVTTSAPRRHAATLVTVR